MFKEGGIPDFNSIMEILRFEKVDDREDLLKKIMIYTLTAAHERQRDRDVRLISNKSKIARK